MLSDFQCDSNPRSDPTSGFPSGWLKLQTCDRDREIGWVSGGETCQLEHCSNWTIIECSWHSSAVQLLSSWKIMQHLHLLIQLSCRTIDQLKEGQFTSQTQWAAFIKSIWSSTQECFIKPKATVVLYSDVTVIKIRTNKNKRHWN